MRCAWARRNLARSRRWCKGWHVYALHAPEVECIGKGKSHKAAGPQPAPWLAVVPWLVRLGNTLAPSLSAPLVQFGVKVSVATTIRRSRGAVRGACGAMTMAGAARQAP